MLPDGVKPGSEPQAVCFQGTSSHPACFAACHPPSGILRCVGKGPGDGSSGPSTDVLWLSELIEAGTCFWVTSLSVLHPVPGTEEALTVNSWWNKLDPSSRHV